MQRLGGPHAQNRRRMSATHRIAAALIAVLKKHLEERK